MAVKHYRELVAWQRSMDLAVRVYDITAKFPNDERFGLVNQLRRCSVSIASNIAEGQGRGSAADFVRFLRIANGSRQECETQLLLAARLDYLPVEKLEESMKMTDEIGRLIAGLMKSIRPPHHPSSLATDN